MSHTSSVGISSYRALPRIAGWGYLSATALGRLPMSMVPLAVLTLVSSATGSIAVGGFASAVAALGEAVGGPSGGGLADRFGQRPVLLVGVAVHVSLLLALTLGAGVLADPATVALAGLVGLSLPQIGAFSRARWLAIAPDDLPAAFAFEGVVDEVVYIFGPALVGLVAAFISPQWAMVMAGAFIVVFATQFALHPSHRLVPRGERVPRAHDARSRAGVRGLMVVVLLGMLAMGVFFGGSQTALTAFADHAGIPDGGALLYAVMAVGSAATTLSMVLVPERVGTWTRWILAASGMAVGALLLLGAPDIPWVIVAGLVAGAFQGPLLLTIYRAVGDVAEAGRAGVLLTLTASGVVLGIALGAAVAGPLADAHGPAGGFVPVVGATVVLLVTGAVGGFAARARRSA